MLKHDMAADAATIEVEVTATSAHPGRLRAKQLKGEDKYTWAPGRVALAQHADLTSSFAPSPNYYAPLRSFQPDAPSAPPAAKGKQISRNFFLSPLTTLIK